MNNAFYNNRSLEVVNITGDGEGSSIGNNAFENCGQSTESGTNVTIDNIASIGEKTFFKSKLSGVTINMAGTGTIGSNAFNPNENAYKPIMKTLKVTGVSNIGQSAFLNNTGLTSIDITGTPTGCTIENQAFRYCGSALATNDTSTLTMTNISVINSDNSNRAFGNSGLTSANISMVGEGKIGAYAFADSNKLVDLTLSGVKRIENDAFAYQGTNGSRAWKTGDTDNIFQIPESVTFVGSGAFGSGQAYNYDPQSMLLIGSNESGSLDITTLKTQMNRLTNSTPISTTEHLLGFGQATDNGKGIFSRKYSGERIIDTKTIVIGANENGLTIEDHFLWHLDSCRTVVLSDCPITLKNCFYGNSSYGDLKLLVFQNTDSDQLNKTTDFLTGSGNKVNTYIVFTGLNSGEVDSFLNGVNNARIAGVFYKDTLTPEVIETIRTAVGADYMRPEVENLLYATINAPTPTRPRPPISSQSNAKPQVSTNLAFLTLEQRKFLGLEE